MAKFRQVHTEFWQDAFVLELTPEEKYFYLYLMTNSKTSQCGIYELPKRIIEIETGYNRETVDKLLQRFIDYGKIKYNEETQEIMLINWIKYNALKSSKVISCVEKELEQVKDKKFVELFYTLCKRYGYPIHRVSIGYEYPNQPVSDGYGEEEEKEEEKEKEEEQEEEKDTVSEVGVKALRFYEKNYGFLNGFITENIITWCEDLSDDLVIYAMQIALKNQKPFSYAEGILRNWLTQNVKTLDDAKALERKFKSQKQENIQGRDVPRDSEIDFSAGEDENWSLKNPF